MENKVEKIYRVERIGDFIEIGYGLNKFAGELEEYEAVLVKISQIKRVDFDVFDGSAELCIDMFDTIDSVEFENDDTAALREVYREIKRILRDARI